MSSPSREKINLSPSSAKGHEVCVVGLACRYPGASTPREFWENILTLRPAFRPIPRERLNLDRYSEEAAGERDGTYATHAALLSGYDFDWRRNLVPKARFEVTDISHWLALDVAREAVADAGLDLAAADRSRIGVIIGNSLTGEVSRAEALRLRWPYVEEVLLRSGQAAGLDEGALRDLVAKARDSFKTPLAEPNEDWLAGVLSNVIAGRVCNALDLQGGGYTVDGACASSLLALKSGAEKIASGELDMVLAGGVDISIDPLELVGFSRAGALTRDRMRVYDQRSSGFIPGEGCGLALLMRRDLAEAGNYPIWADLDGWGVSSDGQGGVTAPKTETQALAMQRCYDLAGYSAKDLDFVEGHGTGTPLGDKVELGAILSQTGADEQAEPDAPLLPREIGVTSVKTLIGHTKAAAGMAGFLKAVLAVNQRILPPMAGLQSPNELFQTPGARIYPITQARAVAHDRRISAGISGAGFGGINCHVAVSASKENSRPALVASAQNLAASVQRAELVIASASDAAALSDRLEELADRANGMADGEFADFAARAADEDRNAPLRATFVSDDPRALSKGLRVLAAAARNEAPAPRGGKIALAASAPRIGYLLPGQGSQFLNMGQRLRHRHSWAARRAAKWDAKFAELSDCGLTGVIDHALERNFDPSERQNWETALRDTRVAQPAISMTSLQWFDRMERLGLTPAALAGHSLGEITAFTIAGLFSEREAMELLQIRARHAAAEGEAGGMLSLRTDAQSSQALLKAVPGYAVIANLNAPDQTVIAGEPAALDALADLARDAGIASVRLNVANAFHSRYMDQAAQALTRLAEKRGGEDLTPEIPVFSGLTGAALTEAFDPYDYAARQVSAPVDFVSAVWAMSGSVDIFLELGPGEILSGLARNILGAEKPILALESSGAQSDLRFCEALASLWLEGATLDWKELYADRFIRPFVPASELRFIENPCERLSRIEGLPAPELAIPVQSQAANSPAETSSDQPLAVRLRDLIAYETGYDHDMMPDQARLVQDLNLDSIKIGEIRGKLAAEGVNFADETILSTASIAEILDAAQIDERPNRPKPASDDKLAPNGIPVLGLAADWQPITLAAADFTGVLTVLGDEEHLQALPEGAEAAIGTARAVERLLVILPKAPDPEALASALGRAAPWMAEAGSVILAELSQSEQTPLTAMGVAQSLSLERPDLPVAALVAQDLASLLQNATAAFPNGASPLRLREGAFEQLRLVPADLKADAIPLSAGDVVVVTGGAKGITAACVEALAQQTNVTLAILGRSLPAEDLEVRETLARFSAAGVKAHYIPCDITDPADVAQALATIQSETGAAPITGFVHGAGINIPAAIRSVSTESYRRELETKCGGFDTVLAALDETALRLCIGFGSIIGVVGMQGNTGYAAANARLSEQLAALGQRVPNCRVRCLAYGVWDEIGMGAKLGVVERLKSLDVHPIPAAEGVEWFLRAAGSDAPELIAISGPMQGLATWRMARQGLGAKAAMLSQLLVDEPGYVTVARHKLCTETAPWLDDHCFEGARLLPLVFALKSMAEAASAVAGQKRMGGITDIRISGPVVVATDAEAVIETDARFGTDGLSAGLGLPGQAHSAPKFAARFLETPGAAPVIGQASGQDVPNTLSNALYDWLLFQGPHFQRIKALTHIDLSDPIRRRAWLTLRREENDGPLPDVFFLDAMLQAMQVLVPQDVCLPTAVAQMRFWPEAWSGGQAQIMSEILEKTDAGYLGRITASDSKTGAPLVEIDGLELVAATRNKGRPDLQDLLDPLGWDRRQLAQFANIYDGLELTLCEMHATDRAERRDAARLALSDIAPEFADALDWKADGAPVIGDGSGPGVSFSHDGGRLLTGYGKELLGVDLQTLGHHGGRDWKTVLPASRQPLWHDLAREMGHPDQAAAMIWAADEALIKAGLPGAELRLLAREGTDLRFAVMGGEVRAGMVQLALAGPAAIAVCTGTRPATAAIAAPYSAASDERIEHFHRRFSMSFKEALPPLRAATAPVVFNWVGDMREQAMADISEPLVDAFLNRSKGILTNFTDLRVPSLPEFGRPVEAWVWMDQVLASQPSSFDLHFAFVQMSDDGVAKLCAEARQRLTWVHLEADGTPSIEPFPDFFAEFIARRRPQGQDPAWTPPFALPGLTAQSASGPALGVEGSQTILLDESFSNLVGNIYYSHLGGLTDRACRAALAPALRPETVAVATALRLDHLGEAMPGDQVEIRARHRHELPQGGHAMEAQILNQSRGGQRIATARLEYLTVPKIAQSKEAAE